MRKIFNILILCLITISQSYSQTNSQTFNKTDSVLVPVKSLKNALIVLEQRNYCRQQLTVVRDSVILMEGIVNLQDSMIINQKQQIELQRQNIDSYVKLVDNKDKEIKIYKDKYNNEKRFKWYGIGGGILAVIISIIF